MSDTSKHIVFVVYEGEKKIAYFKNKWQAEKSIKLTWSKFTKIPENVLVKQEKLEIPIIFDEVLHL